MTDNEIIKISEEYVRRQCENRCEMKKCEACAVNYVKELIKLSCNQKAEIERLKGFQKDGFFKLLGNCLVFSKTLEDYNDMRKGLKTKVIEEFAEKLTDIILVNSDSSLDNPDGNNYFISDVIEDVDNLLKEMVGDTDGCH